MREFEQAKRQEYELKLERAKRDIKSKRESPDLKRYRGDLEKEYGRRFDEFKANLKQ